MIFKAFLKSVLLSFLCLSCAGCSAVSAGQRRFGQDSNYFIGLQLERNGQEKQAAEKFKACVKKGSYYCALKSAEELCKIGSVQEKTQACLQLAAKFPDTKNLLIPCRELLSFGEFSRVVELTDYIDIKTAENELMMYRIEALQQCGSVKYSSSLYEWFTSRAVSEWHYSFYKKHIQPLINELEEKSKTTGFSDNLTGEKTEPNFQSEEQSQLPFELLVYSYRIQIYRRNYVQAFSAAHYLLDEMEKGKLLPLKQITSDLGKAFLYGSQDFVTNGDYLRKLAARYKGTECEFYFWFYAGRLFDKEPKYSTSAKNCFEKAVFSAQAASDRDNAIWYLLNTTSKVSITSTLAAIDAYKKSWSEKDYFDDFFEGLAPQIFASGQFDLFKTIYTCTEGYVSKEITAQYAYIYARLIEEGLVKGTEAEKTAAFTKAMDAGTSIYYKVAAALKLKLKPEQLEAAVLDYSPLTAGQTDVAAERLLEGYAAFGFPEQIYSNYIELYKNGVSAGCSFFLSDFLQKCGMNDSGYYVQSIRIASRGVNFTERQLTPEDFKLFFPMIYKEEVEKECSKTGIDESVMFALIRSESYFDKNVTSHAGAVGLTQLMGTTGQDIARRLKKTDYDLTDAATNIEFGTWYFADLLRRCDGNYLEAFFSYNAGITRVRKWLQSSLVEIGQKKNMSSDLFLETLPYAETREYGRKLVSAAAVYELLYNNSTALTEKILK